MFADNYEDEDEEDESSYRVLAELESELRNMVNDKFVAANSRADVDEDTVIRCCKLFSLVGRAKKGLIAYTDLLTHNLRRTLVEKALTLESRPKGNGSSIANALKHCSWDHSVVDFSIGEVIPYAELMTKIFDEISACAQDNVSALTSHFGPGAHLCLVNQLQNVADEAVVALLKRYMNDIQLPQLVSPYLRCHHHLHLR